ncbi:Kinase, NEK [Giardia muris]|uniref:Kinase, NEK n=1 Tax=Giardia muris TaxID=5742 RepID=A0A4Z1T6L4_GIAMU|nr:Kinase, NEK [Giardia muris]|eukprot:TNJ28121.1 Kinase, NEK [Giardia muris]
MTADFDKCIGRGAYGAVYSLKSAPNEAVKEIPTDHLPHRALTALEAELKLMPQVKHPNIVQYKAVMRTEKFVYIRMAKYKQSLSEFLLPNLRKGTKVPEEVIIKFAAQMGDALAYLHNPLKKTGPGLDPLPSIVHRDIKPANILMDNEGNFYLADFGMCRALSDSISASTYAGTPVYMAPEVIAHQKYDGKADMWSLGVVIYEMAVSRIPNFLNGQPDKVYTNMWRPPLADISDPRIQRLVSLLLVVNPQERSSAVDFLRSPDLIEYFKASSVSTDRSGSRLESQLQEALKEKETRIMHLTRENSHLKTEMDKLIYRISQIETAHGELQKKLEEKDKLIEQFCKTISQNGSGVSSSTESHRFRNTYIDALIDSNARLRNRAIEMSGPAASVLDFQLSAILLQSSAVDSPNESTTKPSLLGSVKGLVEDCNIASIRENFACAMACINEAGDGQALSLLLSGRAQDRYILSRERAQLIRVLAQREGDSLLKSGYSLEYINCLRGKPCADLLLQPDQWTSWFRYAEQGNAQMLEKHISQGGIRTRLLFVVGGMPVQDLTAMMIAASLNHTHAIVVLLEREKRLATKNGKTALMLASSVGNLDSVAILAQSELKMVDERKRTALLQSINIGKAEITRLLIKEARMPDKDSRTPLMVAVRLGHVDIVKILAPLEARKTTVQGYTALMVAAKWGTVECIPFLTCMLRKKTKKEHCTALHLAAQYGHLDAASLLLNEEHGMRTNTGRTALMYAAGNGFGSLVQLLLPVERRLQDNEGKTALIIATLSGNVEMVTLLANDESGHLDSKGSSALMYACYGQNYDCVCVLAPFEAHRFGEAIITNILPRFGDTSTAQQIREKIQEYMR